MDDPGTTGNWDWFSMNGAEISGGVTFYLPLDGDTPESHPAPAARVTGTVSGWTWEVYSPSRRLAPYATGFVGTHGRPGRMLAMVLAEAALGHAGRQSVYRVQDRERASAVWAQPGVTVEEVRKRLRGGGRQSTLVVRRMAARELRAYFQGKGPKEYRDDVPIVIAKA